MSSIDEIYQKAFGRTADAGGAEYWANSGLSGSELESAILGAASTDDRKATLSTQYDDMFGRSFDSDADSFWLNDDSWATHTSGGLDHLTQSIGNSSVGNDEFSFMDNLASDNGQTWSDIFYEPDNANRTWQDLLDEDGFNESFFNTGIEEDPGTLPDLTGAGTTTSGAKTYQDYLNPYLDEVLDNSVRRINEQGEMARNSIGTSAFSAGAFGDARHGIENDNLTQSIMETVGDLSSEVNAQGFESSMGWLNTDLDRQANIALQNAALQNQWLSNQIGLTTTGNQIGLDDYNTTTDWLSTLSGIDQYDRNWTQNDLNADYTDFWARENWDQNQLSSLISVLNGIPGQVSSTDTLATSTPNNQSFGDLGAFLTSALGGGSSTGSIPAAGV